MTIAKSLFLSSAVATLALSLSGSAWAATTIRLAHTANVSHVHHEAALQFAQNVKDRTKGEYVVEVYPAGELGDQPALAEQVTLGALDLSVVSLGNMAMYAKELNAMTAPFCALSSRISLPHKKQHGNFPTWCIFRQGWLSRSGSAPHKCSDRNKWAQKRPHSLRSAALCSALRLGRARPQNRSGDSVGPSEVNSAAASRRRPRRASSFQAIPCRSRSCRRGSFPCLRST